MENSQTNQPIHNLIHHKFSKKPRVLVTFSQPSLTKQSFKDECDINRILARYQATGQIPNINALPPEFLDVTGMDFQEHQNFMLEAKGMFDAMPSSLRARFHNSPALFLDFCSNPENRQEMAQIGLLRPIEEPVIPNPTPNLSTA